MSRVRTTGTDLERSVGSMLRRKRFKFARNVENLPGRPDIVFQEARLAVFVDGDFWHGYRFPVWRQDLSEFWRQKIAGNRARDQRNFRKLRRMGWRVIRVWKHQVKRDLEGCVARIERAAAEQKAKN